MTRKTSSAASESRIAPAVPGVWRRRSPPPDTITWAETVAVMVAVAVGLVAGVIVGDGTERVTVAATVVVPVGAEAGVAAADDCAAGGLGLGPALGVAAAVTMPGTGAGARSSTPTRKAIRASTASASTPTTASNFRRGDMGDILIEFCICPPVGSVVFSSWQTKRPKDTAFKAMTSQEQASAKKKVMIVEDDADFRTLVRMMLGGDLEMIAVEEGAAAMDAIREHRPDLVILDLMLPDMNGWEIFMAMRKEPASANIPVIILSCIGTRHDRSFGLQVARVHDYLVKPCLPSRLRASVASALESRSAVLDGLSGARPGPALAVSS
jgi:CheY-like chemotaxis protein